MNDIEKQYLSLKESGELLEMFPTFTQDWSKDRKAFTRYYEDNQKIFNDNFLDLDDEEQEFYDSDYL